MQVRTYDKNILTRRVRTVFIFLKSMTNLWMKMHLKMTLGHKLAVAENCFTEEAKTEAQSTKFKVTPDKTVSP